MGPSPLPKMLSLETSLVQDVRRSLKVLRNDLDVIVDLLDQKLGIKREETELVDESTLARRKAEELRRRKLEKGYVQGNICRSHVAKDIGSSIVHAGVKVMLLSKTLEDDLQVCYFDLTSNTLFKRRGRGFTCYVWPVVQHDGPRARHST